MSKRFVKRSTFLCDVDENGFNVIPIKFATSPSVWLVERERYLLISTNFPQWTNVSSQFLSLTQRQTTSQLRF